MADKGGLQLLPETRKKIEIKIPGENRLISIGVGIVVLVLIVTGALWLYSNNLSDKITSADKELSDLEAQRDKKAEQNLVTIAKQIVLTNQILKDHVYWSKGFSKIESAVQSNVQFKSLSTVLAEKSIRIRATSDNYTTIAKQLAALVADDSIKDISLDNVSVLTSGKLDFNINVRFDESKFLKN